VLIKCQLCSLHRKKIYKLNIIKVVIVIKLSKVLVKNFYICYKNSVNIHLYIDIRNVLIAVLIQQFHPLLPF